MKVSKINLEDRKAHNYYGRSGSRDDRHDLVESVFNSFIEI